MFKPTAEQEKAIKTTPNVLITAAAGSGKTAVLVERVVKMLKRTENPVSVDRLLIVTFTNAAAGEMRGRIEKRLQQELKNNPSDRNLRRQILMLPSAQICTIDTFCINLVRENFEHFSLSPDFKIATDAELYPLYDSAVREVLDEFYSNDFDRLCALMTALGCGGNEAKLIDAVRKIFDFSTSMPFPAHWFAACKQMYKEGDISLWESAAQKFGLEPRESAQVRAEIEFVAPFMITLLEICERFSDALFIKMREKNMFTFFNTEQMALELLCSVDGDGYKMSEKAEALSAQFDEILVDEYQDVNDLQDTLFYILSDCGKKLFAVGDAKQSIYGFRGANPENFVSKKEAYLPYDEAQGEDSKKIVLSANFRSRAGVCDFINYLFSLTMSKQFGGVDYDEEEKLVPLAAFPETAAPKTEIALIDSSGSELSDAECEAEHIAAYIQSVMAEEPFLRDGDSLRAARYSDFSILMRSPSSHAQTYVDALKCAGIPVALDGGGFLETREVAWVLSLLKVINNPTHDVPLLSLMMSPIFSFSADELAVLRMNNRACSLYSSLLSAEAEGNAHVTEFLETIRKFRRKAVTMSVERLLSSLYDETAILDIVRALEDGERRKDNLRMLLAEAANYTENGGSIAGFVAHIEKVGESLRPPTAVSGNAVTIMSFHGSKGLQFPVCIIAGCHSRFNRTDSTASLVMDRRYGVAFKALEKSSNTRVNTLAREVIAESVARRNISEELRILYVALTRAEERLLITLSNGNHAKKAQNIAKAIRENEGELVKNAGSFYEWFMYALIKNRDCYSLREQLSVKVDESALVCADCKINVSLGAPQSFVPREEQTANCGDSVAAREIIDRMNYSYPMPELTKAPAKVSVSLVSKGSAAENDFSARPAFMSKAGLTPAERGTATHKFMQFADYLSAAESLEGEIKRMTEREFLTKEEAAAINLSELARFFESDIFVRMKNAELHRELRFITEVPLESIGVSGDGKTVMQGVIDCVIDEGETVSVIDFKTDRVKEEGELTARYKKQLEIYSDACARLFARPVKDKLIYSFALGKTIKVD